MTKAEQLAQELRQIADNDWGDVEKTLRDAADELEKGAKDSGIVEWIEYNARYSGGGNGGTYAFRVPVDVETVRDGVLAAMSAQPHANEEGKR